MALGLDDIGADEWAALKLFWEERDRFQEEKRVNGS